MSRPHVDIISHDCPERGVSDLEDKTVFVWMVNNTKT